MSGGEGDIPGLAALRSRFDKPAFDQRPGTLEATRGLVQFPCCAVAKREGDQWKVLLLAGLEQLLLDPARARALALDLVTAAEIAESGPAKDLLPPIFHHPV